MKKSQVVKRSIVTGGHKTSVSLEDEFWAALKKIALTHRLTLSDLVGSIDSQRQHTNLSSAVRLFVLNHYRQRVEVLEIRRGYDPADEYEARRYGPNHLAREIMMQ